MTKKLYTVLAQFEAKPGREQELENMLLSLIEPTLKEEGCINYDLHRCSDNPAKFMFYENWTNYEAFENHINSSHVKLFFEKKDELLAKPFEGSAWEIIK